MKSPGSNGLVMTIASDDEIEPEEASDSESEQLPAVAAAAKSTVALSKAGKKRQRQKAAARAMEKKKGNDGLVDPTFSFDVDGGGVVAGGQQTAVKGWDFKSESWQLELELALMLLWLLLYVPPLKRLRLSGHVMWARGVASCCIMLDRLSIVYFIYIIQQIHHTAELHGYVQ